MSNVSSPAIRASRPMLSAARTLARGFDARCFRKTVEYLRDNPVELPLSLELMPYRTAHDDFGISMT